MFKTIKQYGDSLNQMLQHAGRLLNQPVLPISLDWGMKQRLMEHLQFISRQGLADEPAVIQFSQEAIGHQMVLGSELYRIDHDRGVIDLVLYIVPEGSSPDCDNLTEFWAVPVSQYQRFYRFVRSLYREKSDDRAPVLREHDQQKLWNNTIGFLLKGRKTFAEYGVSLKRGVLLFGVPGTGKTMATRWLISQCEKKGLQWRNISIDTINHARVNQCTENMFDMDAPGLIIFDDLDSALKDRESQYDSDGLHTFLAGLDGVNQQNGVVFLFTSNLEFSHLDVGFRRPGRIDLALRFELPDEELRRKFIQTSWKKEIQQVLDIDQVAEQTAGWSFAEMDEAKKLMVMRFLDDQVWDWGTAASQIIDQQELSANKKSIGFHCNPAVEETVEPSIVAHQE